MVRSTSGAEPEKYRVPKLSRGGAWGSARWCAHAVCVLVILVCDPVVGCAHAATQPVVPCNQRSWALHTCSCLYAWLELLFSLPMFCLCIVLFVCGRALVIQLCVQEWKWQLLFTWLALVWSRAGALTFSVGPRGGLGQMSCLSRSAGRASGDARAGVMPRPA